MMYLRCILNMELNCFSPKFALLFLVNVVCCWDFIGYTMDGEEIDCILNGFNERKVFEKQQHSLITAKNLYYN